MSIFCNIVTTWSLLTITVVTIIVMVANTTACISAMGGRLMTGFLSSHFYILPAPVSPTASQAVRCIGMLTSNLPQEIHANHCLPTELQAPLPIPCHSFQASCCVNKRMKEPTDTPMPPRARFHPIFRT